MMQFYMGGLLLVGITKRNMEKLMDGQPIAFTIKGKEPVKDVAIMYGEDKIKILDQLEKTGCQIPVWMRESAEKDPT